MKLKPMLSVTEQFFDDKYNHLVFLEALEKTGVSSTDLSKYFTTRMSLADANYDLSCLGIPCWKDIFYDCHNQFINMTKISDMESSSYKITDFYLANYMCLVLQYENHDFAGYVRAWYLDKINYIERFEE